jgi:hypothetical protein
MNDKQSLLPLLRAAREWLSKKEHWSKGAFARDSGGGELITGSVHTASTCAMGAFYKEGIAQQRRYDSVLERLTTALPSTFVPQAGYNPVIAYNDAPERTHEEVLAWFDRAIEQQMKEEAA